MKYYLTDAAGKRHGVTLPNGTTEVAGVIISGDEILVYPVYRDTGKNTRIYDFYDGYFHKVLINGEWVEK